MDALEALHTRVSVSRVGDQPPDDDALENIFKAALRAPDHALLRPWRFLVIREEGRAHLGKLFAEATRADDPEADDNALQKAASKPFRAPLLVVAIARIMPHPKVPEVEQIVSTGAAMQNMLIAAHAQGVGAMWRTGGMAYHPVVQKGLGLDPNERVVGFLYLGEIEGGRVRNVPDMKVDDFFEQWPKT